jgi:Ca2+-binding RTX toxin-like protein
VGDGNNNVLGGANGDTITASSGNDTFDGGNGSHVINAGDGNNVVDGGTGADTITTGSGADIIRTGDGANSVSAGSGNDNITGGAVADTIFAGGGDDTITAGGGADSLSGGGGANLYVVATGDTGITEANADKISDWTSTDRFDFGSGPVGSGTNYFEGAAGCANDFAAAVAAADTALDGTVVYAAISYTGGVAVFYDINGDGTADQAVVLTGRALTDISSANFV